MAVKVDLAKAYDRLEWSFIHKVLIAFHLPQSLIELIMSCISTTIISLLFMEASLTTLSPREEFGRGIPCLHTYSSFVWSILDY